MKRNEDYSDIIMQLAEKSRFGIYRRHPMHLAFILNIYIYLNFAEFSIFMLISIQIVYPTNEFFPKILAILCILPIGDIWITMGFCWFVS